MAEPRLSANRPSAPDAGAGADAFANNPVPPPFSVLPDGGQQQRPDGPSLWTYGNVPGLRSFKDKTLPTTVKDAFTGTPLTDQASLPGIVYPLPGSMHPMNFGDITIQWHRGSDRLRLFRIEVKTDDERFHFYVPCLEAQCKYTMPVPEWVDLAYRTRGKSATIIVTGSDETGGATATSDEITIHFSAEPVRGGLYYWSTALKGLKRAALGAPKAVPFVVPNSPANQFNCTGCHSVSRNGAVLSFAVAYDDTGGFAIQSSPADVPASPYFRPTKGGDGRPQDRKGDNVALSPDGTLAAVNKWPRLEVWDTKTGNVISSLSVGAAEFGADYRYAILPEWSPDGRSLVVTLTHPNRDGTKCDWTFYSCTGTIGILPYEGGQFGAARVLVANAPEAPRAHHFYPSWSPDGRWIAFVSAPKPVSDSEVSASQRHGVLRLVPAEGGPHVCPGPNCHELTNATQYTAAIADMRMGKGSSWPKFTPFAQPRAGADAGRFVFLAFSSRIDYGFLASRRTQLWLAAVDTYKLADRQDPSYPPVWIPLQDVADQSLTPYWTETLVCSVDAAGRCTGCAEGEECDVSGGACSCTAVRIVE